MTEIEKVKDMLESGGHTAVLLRGDRVYTTDRRGVAPLVVWLNSAEDFRGYFAADKVVGRGAGFLYIMLGVEAVYAGVVSKGALGVLQDHGIHVEYGRLVENIVNRQGTGICPFEKAVDGIDHVQDAYNAILKKIEEMGIEI